MPSAPTLVWFRQDLRLADNPALRAAVASGGEVIPVYIHDIKGEGTWAPGGASRWWLHHALADLEQQFQQFGVSLIIRSGDSLSVLQKLLTETGAEQVVWNRRYEPAIVQRDTQIKTVLRNAGKKVESFNGSLLHEPSRVKNLSGNPFQVFTPFWKNCLANHQWGEPENAPSKIRGTSLKISSETIDSLNLLPKIKWDRTIAAFWNPTRAGAEKRLADFVASPAKDYDTARDFPEHDGTSRLSPYLHFGQISPLEAYARVKASPHGETKSGQRFLAEIGWREFGYHLLHHFNHTPEKPLRAEFERFPWAPDSQLLRSWQKGRTGFPIVDAGMRQLWQTGWQHNRVRMIAASVLVKHLLQPWQSGAAWFWDTLVDADLASNTLGWQWAGGCGADAAPYFRVFNPVLQGEKFDPQGTYVRQYVPELAKMPAEWIHKPWEAPADVLRAAGVELGVNYPRPAIGLNEGRDRALAAFEKLKK